MMGATGFEGAGFSLRSQYFWRPRPLAPFSPPAFRVVVVVVEVIYQSSVVGLVVVVFLVVCLLLPY